MRIQIECHSRALPVLVGLIVLAHVACQSSLSLEDAQKRFPGEYRLVVGSNQVIPGKLGDLSKSLVSEKLVLREDGTFGQWCEYISGEKYHDSGKTWKYTGNLYFEEIRDCSGFLGLEGGKTGASLIVRTGEPILILLNPDRNVFYERKGGVASPSTPSSTSQGQ